MAPPSYRGQPVRLNNGMFLNIEIALQINRASQRLETTAATFTYQAGADNDNPCPVFAYHYDQHSRSRYPRCHVHVHAAPQHYVGERSFSRLHLPTRRLTVEQIVWRLIQEHGVQPRQPDWHDRSSGTTKPGSATPNATRTGPTTHPSSPRPAPEVHPIAPTAQTQPTPVFLPLPPSRLLSCVGARSLTQHHVQRNQHHPPQPRPWQPEPPSALQNPLLIPADPEPALGDRGFPVSDPPVFQALT